MKRIRFAVIIATTPRNELRVKTTESQGFFRLCEDP